MLILRMAHFLKSVEMGLILRSPVMMGILLTEMVAALTVPLKLISHVREGLYISLIHVIELFA